MSRVRVRASYTPQWSDVQAWAAKTISQNKWRCDRILDPEDLLSEAYLVFAKVANKYPRVIEQRHFFALFKTAFKNYLHDQARAMKRRHMALDDQTADLSDAEQVGEWSHEGGVLAEISSVPELDRAYKVLKQNPRSLRRVFVGKRENLNMKLARITGTQYDYMTGFREALT